VRNVAVAKNISVRIGSPGVSMVPTMVKPKLYKYFYKWSWM